MRAGMGLSGRKSAASLQVQFFRAGKFGLAGLMVVAVGLLLMRRVFGRRCSRHMGKTIEELLPGMLRALYHLWDGWPFSAEFQILRERPQRAAALWSAAVFVQAAAIGAWRGGFRWNWGGILIHRFS